MERDAGSNNPPEFFWSGLLAPDTVIMFFLAILFLTMSAPAWRPALGPATLGLLQNSSGLTAVIIGAVWALSLAIFARYIKWSIDT